MHNNELSSSLSALFDTLDTVVSSLTPYVEEDARAFTLDDTKDIKREMLKASDSLESAFKALRLYRSTFFTSNT